ncbi:MAG: heavy-metal-associated domain-containing protein [Synechococcales cyanobacterium RM1_1_8]|nr:heavy-metal-associated domain-containing protein [Synechococcales cyanobacterium RM1_1_8]
MKLQLTVPQMACEACAETITKAIQSVDSGAQVQADPKTKQVEVETTASEAALKEALSQAGYPAN